jgi:GTP-binding protein Era
VSAKTKEGVGRAPRRSRVAASRRAGLLPETQATDLAPEERIAEIVREKALHLTREEVPHAITVEVDELEDGRVHAVIYVETESQKGIVVGRRRDGARDRHAARPEVEALVGGRVFLELQVKVRPKWRRDPRMLERLGL